MRKAAPRHLAPPLKRNRTRGIAVGVVGATIAGLSVYGFSQATDAAARPLPEVTAAPVAIVHTAVVEETMAPAEVSAELSARQDALDASQKKVSKEAQRLATTFVFPSEGKIGSPWGMRMHPILHRWKMHEGVDIGAACGTPITSVLAGTVTQATYGGASGNHVRIDHGTVNGEHIETDSLHMTKYIVGIGDKVQRADGFVAHLAR